MSGTFLMGSIPVRSGVYYRREAVKTEVAGSTQGVAAVLFQSDWGELNKVVDVDVSEYNNLDDLYGDGSKIIRELFTGGALTVKACRVGSDDGKTSKLILKTIPTEVTVKKSQTCTVTETAKSFTVPADFDFDNFTAFSGETDVEPYITLGDNSVTISDEGIAKLNDKTFVLEWNTFEEKILDAVELTSAYVGDREFSVSVRTNLITEKRQLLIYTGTDLYATFTFNEGGDEAQALVDAAKSSKLFNVRKLNSGTLADVTQVPLTGGQNPTVTNSSYERGTNLLERYRWNAICADSDSASVHAILTAFVRQSYETGHLGMAVIAGTSTQDLDERIRYASAINDEKVVYLLNGWIGIDGTRYDGFLAAARIAGMVAGSESSHSITHDTISNALELIEPLTNSEIIKAEERGCLVLSLNSSDQCWCDNGINTLTTLDDERDAGWKKIRRTKTRFECIERVTATVEPLIGNISNDELGRSTVRDLAQRVINEMISEQKLFAGSNIQEDSNHRPEGDVAYFTLTIADCDSLEKIMLTFRFQYSNPFGE